MRLRIDKKDCLKEYLIVPEGFRLVKDWELLKGLRSNDLLFKLLREGCVWCKGYDGDISVAWFGYGSVNFGIDADDSLNDFNVARGVFIKK